MSINPLSQNENFYVCADEKIFDACLADNFNDRDRKEIKKQFGSFKNFLENANTFNLASDHKIQVNVRDKEKNVKEIEIIQNLNDLNN